MRKKTAAFLIAVFCAVAGVLLGSQRLLKVTHISMAIKGLPPELDGLKILQISDLHADSSEKIRVNVWEKADELEFDVVALTGDIIDRNARQIKPHLPYIEKLASEYPVFFCEGNHDHYSMRELVKYLEGSGVTVLLDEKENIEYNGVEIAVIGVNDYYTADLDVSASLFTETDKFRLALFHQPQHVDSVDLSDSPCLVLAGHTHGGQWRVPFLPTLYAPGQGFLPKYGYGAYEIGDAKMFVSKGVGATGKMPVRIWNRPEICVITLRAEE